MSHDHAHTDHDGAEHEHSQLDGDPIELPGRPDLRQLKTQAKELRRGARGGNPDDVALVRRHHPRGEAIAADPDVLAALSLRDAQLVLARRYGFPGWNALQQNVGRGQVRERDLHKFFGTEFNNEVWDLIDEGVSPASDVADRALVLYGAYASLRHWLDAGTVANQARGEHLVARAAIAIGLPDVSLRHARRCIDLVEGHPDAMAVWDAPFAHEALARALAASGDVEGGVAHRARAIELTAALADPEDRAILDGELGREPWFGLT